MRARRSIELLMVLHNQGSQPEVYDDSPTGTLAAWKSKVAGVLESSFGPDSSIVKELGKVRYCLPLYSSNTPQQYFDGARRSGVRHACALIESALFQLEAGDVDEPVNETAFEPGLWEHVRPLVESEDWEKVPAQVTIFLEDQVREWCGKPVSNKGEALVGKGLYARVLGDESDYRLGRQASEREGWRSLGMGMAQAIGNVDRHRLQKRDDLKRYAIGVLGLGSLILTQLRFEHGDILGSERTAP